MKIKVKIGKKREAKHGIRHINLAFPNSLLKSRLTVKIIRQGLKKEIEKGKKLAISPDYIDYKFVKTLYVCLKSVIKRYGHFNLVEVDAADGTKVIIGI